MSICNHVHYKGTKCCPLCYPSKRFDGMYHDCGVGVVGVSEKEISPLMVSTKSLPSTSVHHVKKRKKVKM